MARIRGENYSTQHSVCCYAGGRNDSGLADRFSFSSDGDGIDRIDSLVGKNFHSALVTMDCIATVLMLTHRDTTEKWGTNRKMWDKYFNRNVVWTTKQTMTYHSLVWGVMEFQNYGLYCYCIYTSGHDQKVGWHYRKWRRSQINWSKLDDGNKQQTYQNQYGITKLKLWTQKLIEKYFS